MCLDQDCDDYGTSFSRLRECMDHYRTAHHSMQKSRCLFQCQADCEEMSDYEWHKHLGKHMKDVRLMVLPRSLYQSRERGDTMLDDFDMDSMRYFSSHADLDTIVEEEENGEPDNSVYKALKSSVPISKEQIITEWRDDSYSTTMANIVEDKGNKNIGYLAQYYFLGIYLLNPFDAAIPMMALSMYPAYQ